MSFTLKDFQRWKRVQEKADDLRDPIESQLRIIWDNYYCYFRRTGDRFPDDVDTIDFRGDRFTITGDSYCRGTTDRDSCSIPIEFVFGDRDEFIRKKELAEQIEKEKVAQQKELREREEYDRLKSKFGD